MMNKRVECLKWWRALTPEERTKKINEWKMNTAYAAWSNILIEASSSMIEKIWEYEQSKTA